MLIGELAAAAQRDPQADYRVALIFFNDGIQAYSLKTPLSVRDPAALGQLERALTSVDATSMTDLDEPFQLVVDHSRLIKMSRSLVVLMFTDGNHNDGFASRDHRGGKPTTWDWELSRRRAEAVRNYLRATGLPIGKVLSCAGYADLNPATSNRTQRGRASNRRVEVILIPTGRPPLDPGWVGRPRACRKPRR